MTSYPVGPKARYAVSWRTCDAAQAGGRDIVKVVMDAVARDLAESGVVPKAIASQFPSRKR